MNTSTASHAAALLGWLILLSALTSCGGQSTASVEGTVTYRGEPLPAGRVVFHPQEGRPAFGDIHHGRFTLTTLEPRDGALLGVHRVSVSYDRPVDPDDAFSDRISLIPQRYTRPETSGLTAEVRPGANEFPFELVD